MFFARYVLTGAFATATGALAGGAGAGVLLSTGLSTPQTYRVLLWCLLRLRPSLVRVLPAAVAQYRSSSVDREEPLRAASLSRAQ
jgi:hypothetical protein